MTATACTLLTGKGDPVPRLLLIGALLGALLLQLPASALAAPVDLLAGWNLIDIPLAGTGVSNASTMTASIDAFIAPDAVQAIAIYVDGRFQVFVPGYSPEMPLAPSQGIAVLLRSPGSWNPTGTPYS